MRVLQVEFKKTNRNQAVIEDLMSRTFPFRRNAIMKECHDLDTIFERFPFLQEGDQVGLFYEILLLTCHKHITCIADGGS